MDEGSGAVAVKQHAFGDQVGDRLSQRGARYFEQLAQHALGRKQLRLREASGLDLAPERIDHGTIELLARRSFDRHGHAASSPSVPPARRIAPSTASRRGWARRLATSGGKNGRKGSPKPPASAMRSAPSAFSAFASAAIAQAASPTISRARISPDLATSRIWGAKAP